MRPPKISDSTKEERQGCIREMFPCIGDCDSCGLCQIFHGKEPEIVFDDYIEGRREFLDISRECR